MMSGHSVKQGIDTRSRVQSAVSPASRWPERALVRAIISYVWFGIVIFLALSASTDSSGDSGGYRDPTHRNFELVRWSLEGHWLRSPTIIIPFTLLGSDRAIEIGQAVALGLAFTFLILTVFRITCISASTKAVVGFLLATMLLSPAMLSWNLQILSEALAVSYALVALACSLRFLLRWNPAWLVAAAAAAMLAISAKPPMTLVFLPLILAGIVIVGWRALANRDDRGTKRLLVPAAAITGAVVLLGTGLLYASLQSNARLDSGIPNQKDSLVHLISVQDPINGAIRHSLQSSGIPSCVPLGHAVSVSQIYVLEDSLIHSCPQFTKWSVAHYDSWYLGFLLDHPGKTRLVLSDLLPYSLGDDLNQQVVSVVIPPLSAAIWGSTSVPNAQVQVASPILAPLAFEDAIYAAVLAVNVGGIWLFLQRRRRLEFRGERLLLYCFLLYIIDTAACVIVWQVLFMPLSGIENARLALEGNVLMRASLIITGGLVMPFLYSRWKLKGSTAQGSGPDAGGELPPEESAVSGGRSSRPVPAAAHRHRSKVS